MTDHTEALTLIRDALGETISVVRNTSISSGQHMGRNNWDRLARAEATLDKVDKLLAPTEPPAAADTITRSQYDHVCDRLTQARMACGDVTAGSWIWMDTAEDDLPSMADGAVISITAGALRALLSQGMTVPEATERPWTDATDPVVESWVGREIEVFDNSGSWPGTLRRAEVDVLRVDYNDDRGRVPVAIYRAGRKVRLAEVPK